MTEHSVWRWEGYGGRGGVLDGVFAATHQEIGYAMGESAYLGEVLGKHSDVVLELVPEDFTELPATPQAVAFVLEHGPFGRNPLDYVRKYVDCSECGKSYDETEEECCGEEG